MTPARPGSRRLAGRPCVPAILLAAVILPALACGPFFPNSLLTSGDDAIQQAPTVSFLRELQRLRLEPPPRLVQPSWTGSERAVTTDAEIFDLRRALGRRALGSNEIADAVRLFSRGRADLEDHARDLIAWSRASRPAPGEESGNPEGPPSPASPRPEMKPLDLPAVVPREFAVYLQGAVAWHDERTEEARRCWSEILGWPAAERPFKSTWAAYMLGRSWHDEDPAKATQYYEQTRRFVRAGLSDTAGLGVASLGWQAQLRLRTNDLAGALRLYLDQFAAGATNAALSLSLTARRITEADAPTRLAIARDPVFRRAVTAWILANYGWSYAWVDDLAGAKESLALQRRWLETIEETGAAEVPLAESLAVLAYQAGEWTTAQRWVELAGDSAVAHWIEAKLQLREGHLDEAARTLASVVERLPLDAPDPTRGERPEFVDSLFDQHDNVPGRHEALGELGVLRLTRGEFAQALDALLRAGFWQDAAYVAERVLTLDELKHYVEVHWPAAKPTSAATARAGADATREAESGEQHERIRYLLARRLTRAGRGREAAPYLPAKWHSEQARYLALLQAGHDATRARPERAAALFGAAWLARTNGIELLGTEMAPDYAIWDGQYEAGPTHEFRATNQAAVHLPASGSEIERAAAHPPRPDQRFHYRYTAARLAWDAARLLPNNDPETARILYTGGSWLKARDPETADLFYKALVRRCRRTELGDAADRQRWFPELDADGHPIVTRRADGSSTRPRPAPAADDDEAPPDVATPEPVLPEPQSQSPSPTP